MVPPDCINILDGERVTHLSFVILEEVIICDAWISGNSSLRGIGARSDIKGTHCAMGV